LRKKFFKKLPKIKQQHAFKQFEEHVLRISLRMDKREFTIYKQRKKEQKQKEIEDELTGFDKIRLYQVKKMKRFVKFLK